MLIECPMCKSPVPDATTTQAASILDKQPNRIRQMCEEGKFMGASLSRTSVKGELSWRIPLDSILAYKKEREL
jgi:hypothetical protein